MVLLHTGRRDGAPTVQSRWLWRLATLARGAGVQLPSRPGLLDWAAELDRPGAFAPAERPRPRPPVADRPDRLSVTRIETWVRDPYAIYAQYVLGLRPLDRPGEPVEARARGEAVHRALQRFVEAHPDQLPPDAEAVLEGFLVAALEEAGMPGAAMARERPLAGRAAGFLVEFERQRRPGAALLVEQAGELPIDLGEARFTVTARADRIELKDGFGHVLDFKTGAPPSAKQVESHFAPQLTLTAAILKGGGFSSAGPVRPGELLYVQVTGRNNQKPPRAVAGPGESEGLADAALEGLRRRAAHFLQPETPYVSWAAPQFMLQRGGDYDHLARVWEWHVIGEAGEGEA